MEADYVGGRVSCSEGHALRIQVRGDHLVVYWEGAKVIDTHDRTWAASLSISPPVP